MGVLPGASEAPKEYLGSKRWEFPACPYSTEGGVFITISERQAELQFHITMCHGRSGTEERNKCQTQTKEDRQALKTKTSAVELTLWRNAWQRYLKETGPGGLAAVTQLWECLSSETAVGLISAGLGEEEDIAKLMDEIRKSVIGNLNTLSQRVKLLKMGQHDGETVRKYATRLGGKTDWCGLEIPCSWSGCDQKNSYAIMGS